MKRFVCILTFVVSAVAIGGLLVQLRTVSAQNKFSPRLLAPTPSAQPPETIYNPYPAGILPADLVSEIARVRSEIAFIFNQAIAEWQALPPITFTSNPPTIQGNGYQAVITLGKLLNFDENMSPFRNRACAFCHMPYTGFSGPIPSVNLTMVAYPGSMQFRAGKRTAQRYSYSPRFPVMELYPDQNLLFGGNFWDGRATGYLLQSADAEQSQHPPVDTQEHALPDTACIAWRISQAQYRPLFEQIWGFGSFEIAFPANTETICSTPGGASTFAGSATPIQLSPVDRTRANSVYNHWAHLLAG
jgi:hypothetical protein